ncbi:MAG: hypothetical protein NWR72_05475, partial [Bacteroidia bacterium]|nr:hypothetical protein [Bacteroidia bacterium]
MNVKIAATPSFQSTLMNMSSSNHISQWLLLGFLAVALLKADPSHAQLPSLQVVDSIETNFSKDYLPIPIDL